MARMSHKAKLKRINKYLQDLYGGSIDISVIFHIKGQGSEPSEEATGDATEKPKAKVGVYPFDRPEDMRQPGE